ncbi:MAG: dephospho-CoA kinase [Acidobacteria bacterium]|nr:dephospho-CoA kinase [Acidobacteriota bacterium]
MGIFVGLTGPNASGKGEAAACLEGLGFRRHSLADVVRREAARRGLDPGRENLIRIGNEMRAAEGWGVLARRILPDLGGRDVIDSIRHPAEVEVLRSLDRFLLLAIEAPVEMRFDRTRRRARPGDALTLEEFRRTEDREVSGTASGSQRIAECIRVADARVCNDGGLDRFHRRIRQALAAAGMLL